LINEDKINVLLIEDNPGDARYIKEMLKEVKLDKFNLITKSSLSEGLEEVLQNKTNIILLDLMLPDASGLGTVTILLEKVRDIPIIVLTGRVDEELAIRTLKLGVQDYIIKGNIDSYVIERSITFALERHNVKKEIRGKERLVREALYHTKFYEDIFIHNVNNTFQGILSATELCSMQLDKLNESDHQNLSNNIKDLLRIIKDQILEGTNLISNIRKLTQIEEKNIELEPININIILDQLIKKLKNNFVKHQIDIKIISPDITPFVNANNLLNDAFENILNNAVRHNQNQIIEIIIKISKTVDNNISFIKIEFIDNGSGIENSRRKTIFSREYIDTNFVGGLGLGLSLTNKIIESYQGKIWIESRIIGDYSKGSNFVVLIPEVMQRFEIS